MKVWTRQALRIALLAGVMQSIYISEGHAITVQQIEVEGNHRIERESILYHSGLKPGDEISPVALNAALKSLFDTNLFTDVNVRQEGGRVIIRVEENPIINRVVFEGNRRVNDDTLKAEVTLKARDVFTRSRVQADTLRIQSIYRRQGRFAATVTPKLIKLDQNRVDLVFEVNEGPLTGVKKILFVGNKRFSSSKLKSVLRTKETRWYRFLTTDDNYDPERVAFDRELLRVHYLHNGYVDFKVLSSVAELVTDKTGFFITYTIEEGQRYKMGEVKVTSHLKDVKLDDLRKLVPLSSGDWYNSKKVEEGIDQITDHMGDRGFAFVAVEPHFKKNTDTHTVDIEFEVKEGARVYIGNIDIHGNLATYDKVVRREFRLAEGDAFNTSKLRRSEQRLRNLDFFSTVNIEKESGDAPDKVNLKVEVKEKSTGEIAVAGGITTIEGLIGQISFSERNFLGRGQELRSDLTISKRTREFDISFTEPYFLDMNLAAGIDLFKVRYDQTQQSGFIHHRQGSSLRTGFSWTEPLTQRFWYTLRQDVVNNVRGNLSEVIREQQGKRVTSSIAQALTYDKRDNRVDPTNGYMVSISNEYAGVGGQTRYFRHVAEAKFYKSVFEDVVFSLRGSGGIIQKVGQPVRIVDRFHLGGETLRGFEYYGVSPRVKTTEKNDAEAIGGRLYYTGSAELQFPIGLPNELGIKGGLFTDVGSIWRSDQSPLKVHDSKKLRTSVGFGIAWASPLGPMRLDIAKALKYEKFDKRQAVLFSFRTTF